MKPVHSVVLALGTTLLLTASAAVGQERLEVLGQAPPEAALERSEAASGETSSGSCSGCSGWVWAHALECWRYVSGSEERMWMYFRESLPSFAEVDTGDARHDQFIEACGSAHWIGTFWTSSSQFSNVRLWYN